MQNSYLTHRSGSGAFRRVVTTLVLAMAAFGGFLALFGGLAQAAVPAAPPARPSLDLPRQAITRTWENLGLYGGVVSAIAIDPGANAPTGTVYAGTTSGQGLYRSLDGGDNWEGIYTASVQALAVNQLDHIVWAIGEQGILTSADMGSTWNSVPYPSGISGWARLLVSDTMTVLATGNTVARSLDGGATWDTALLPCSGCQVTALTFDPHTNRIIAGTDTDIYASDASTLGFAVTGSGHGMQDIVSLAASPFISGLLYAGTGDLGGAVRHSLFRSTDGGATWTNLSTMNGAVGYIVFHPVLTQTVYAGGMAYDGSTFTPLGHGVGNSHFALYPTTPYTMFGAIDQGINRSTDGGRIFYPTNQGIDGVVVQDFAQNPRDLGVYFINTKNGIARTFDAGRTWDFPLGFVPGAPSQPVGSHFGSAAAAPYYPVTYTARAFLGELYTDDYGDSTAPLGNPSLRSQIESSGCVNCAAFINSIAADPAAPLTVYAAVGGHHIPAGNQEEPYGGLWESGDGGTTWTQHTSAYSAGYGSLPYTTPARIVAFAQGGVAYAALGDFRNHTDLGGGMFGGVISRTTSSAWQLLSTITNPITASVEGLAIDPNNPLRIWAGTGGTGMGPSSVGPRLYRSDDGGVSWEDRTPPGAQGPFQAIAVHPRNSNTVFAAAGQAVFYTANAGNTWVRLPDPPRGPQASAETVQRLLLPTLPPAPVENLTGTVSGGNVILTWTLPTDPRFQGVLIRGDAGRMPRTSIEGTSHGTWASPATGATFAPPANPYSVTVFSYDSAGRYGIGLHLAIDGSTVIAPGRRGRRRSRATPPASVTTDALVAGTARGLFQLSLEGLVSETPTNVQIFLPAVRRSSSP